MKAYHVLRCRYVYGRHQFGFGWLGLSDQAPSFRDWTGEQVTVNLHPVRPHPIGQWQYAMAKAMSGPQASTVFRSTASKMDCYWRLSATGQAPPLPQDFHYTIFNQSILGASLGLRLRFAPCLIKAPNGAPSDK